MSRGVASLLACILLTTAAAAGQAPIFSSRVDAVRVDVLVTDRGRVVRGLGPGDFELLDDGVVQQVEFATFEQMPLSVVLVFDMSDSVAGERLEHLRAAGLAVVDGLEPEDRVALVTFSHALSIEAPLTSDRARVRGALQRASGAGRTALLDASHAGMLLAEPHGGRTLMILFSDGVDTASLLTGGEVLETARGSDVVVYGVVPAAVRDGGFPAALAELTGGALLRVDSTADLAAAFTRILDEFRQRYVLSFTPRGVRAGGWHRLQVRVKGRSVTVRARPGYQAAP